MISKKDVPQLNPGQIEHIANLARIKVTDEEKVKLEHELSEILSFIETLNRVDTEHITPVTGGTTLMNESKEDELSKAFEGSEELILGQIPEKERGYIKVKSVF